MKKKIIILVILIVSTLFISGITYSKFNSKASLTSDDEKIASFVFDGKKTDNINISLDELKPGDLKDYTFTVSNNNENYSSDVTLNYTAYYETEVQDFQTLINFLINNKKINKNFFTSAWHTQWRGRLQVLKILNVLYKDCPRHLQRKYDKYFSLKNSLK